MSSVAVEKLSRTFYGWWMVLSAAVGLFFSYSPIVTFSFGVLLNPLSREFGWSRTEISLAYSLSMLAFAASQPWVGRVLDRRGARPVILLGAGVYGFCLGSLVWLTPSLVHLYAVYAAMGIAGAGTCSMAQFKALTRWFDRRRGVAIGLALSGNGLSAFAIPSVTQLLVAGLGWRMAYLGLGLAVVGFTLPVVGLLHRESPESMGLTPDGEGSPAVAAPESAAERVGARAILSDPRFWLIAGPFWLVSVSLIGSLTHLVPMLTDRGISPQDAALAASLLGGATLLGRIGVGILLDRFFAPHIAAALFGTAALGIAALWSGTAGPLAFLAAFLLGMAGSADGIIPYLVSRTFGLERFGETYGMVVGVNILGWVGGPLFMGLVYDATGSYRGILAVGTVAISTAAALMGLVAARRLK
jgi:MFS family permease